MAVTVVGSIAFDSVRTPFGEAERELGGSGFHAALIASYFTDVRLVSVVGDDFEAQHRAVLDERGVDTTDVEHATGGRTLNWRVRYDLDLALAQPEGLDLGVFNSWQPRLLAEAAEAKTLFLGVMDPEAQIAVRSSWKGEGWSILDTLRHWVETKRDALVEAMSMVDIVLLTDQEARGLTRQPSLLDASREIRSWGAKAVVVKRGEYGCSLLTEEGYFALPGYPLETVVDPTGSGDSFSGGLTGYLDLVPVHELTEPALRRAISYGTVMASFCVEAFGARRTASLSRHEIDHRADAFRRMTHFEHVSTSEAPLTTDDRDTRIERPDPTPSMHGYDAPARTPSIQPQASPARPPGSEPPTIIENPIKDPR